jgi:PAS domain S-box-containing protein
MPPQPAPYGAHRRARINYYIRTSSFAYSFVVLALHGAERAFGAMFWTLLVLQFLVYPHLAYLRARHSADSRRAEETNIYVDAELLGAWAAALHFPVWITYGGLFSTMLNATVLRGTTGALWSIGCFATGAALCVAVVGLDFGEPTSPIVTVLCFLGSLGYACGVGYVVFHQNKRLGAARDELRASEERYRLIAENAGDLIAMVDQEGRWLYTSPSHERVLDTADLAAGADAFRRLHPDDAEQARGAVAGASLTAKPTDLALRLLDKQGRVRQYRTRIQSLERRGGTKRVLLVSQDVTDLRESEERVLLAAHAFEGMTEAIAITAADGTIATVNRAFCELTGFARDDVLGQSEKVIRNSLQGPAYYDDIYATVTRAGYWSGTTWARRKNGSIYREWRSIRAVKDADGAVTHYVLVLHEVDAQDSAPASEATKA